MTAKKADWFKVFGMWPLELGKVEIVNKDGLCCTIGHMGRVQGLTDEELNGEQNQNYELVSTFWSDVSLTDITTANDAWVLSAADLSSRETNRERSMRMYVWLRKYLEGKDIL